MVFRRLCAGWDPFAHCTCLCCTYACNSSSCTSRGIFHPTHWMDSNFEGPQPRGSPSVPPIPSFPAEDTSVCLSSTFCWSWSSSSVNGDSSSSRCWGEAGSIHPIPYSRVSIPPLIRTDPSPSRRTFFPINCPVFPFSVLPWEGNFRRLFHRVFQAIPCKWNHSSTTNANSRAHQTACTTHVRTAPAFRSNSAGSNRDAPAAAKQEQANWEPEEVDQGTVGDTKRRHVHGQWERKPGYNRIHDRSMLGGLKQGKALLTLRHTTRKETCVGEGKFRSHGTVLENDRLGTSFHRLGD